MGLERAARQRQVQPEGDLGRIRTLFGAESEAVRAVAVRLAGHWKVEELRPPIEALARATATPEGLRASAIEALALLGGPKSRVALEELSHPGQPIERRRLAIVALASFDAPAGARQGVELLAGGLASDPTSKLVTSFLQQKPGPAALAAALAGRKLPADAAKVALRTVRASGRDLGPLLTALAQAGGLPAGPRVLSPAELQDLVTAVTQHGNAARGEALFRRRDLACLKCHAIAGAGGQVGPDLLSIGASAQVDYLIESLLQPNKAVKENYHALNVATKAGRVFTGVKVRESNAELVLRDGEDQEVIIPLDSIEERTIGGSLMPDGLTEGLTNAELADLVRFLSELGKVGPYAVGKARVVRRWQALEATPDALAHLRQAGLAAVVADQPALTWTPAYSRVAGDLPLDAVSPLKLEQGPIGIVRCQISVSSSGKIKLRLNSALGLSLWLDKTSVTPASELLLEFTPGVHTLTFAVRSNERQEALRCELEDIPGSQARAHVVAGK
jgi:putative heme-binding domain-containing protein